MTTEIQPIPHILPPPRGLSAWLVRRSAASQRSRRQLIRDLADLRERFTASQERLGQAYADHAAYEETVIANTDALVAASNDVATDLERWKRDFAALAASHASLRADLVSARATAHREHALRVELSGQLDRAIARAEAAEAGAQLMAPPTVDGEVVDETPAPPLRTFARLAARHGFEADEEPTAWWHRTERAALAEAASGGTAA